MRISGSLPHARGSRLSRAAVFVWLTLAAACATEAAPEPRLLGQSAASVCGPSADFQRVDDYQPTRDVSRAFVEAHADAVGRLSYRNLRRLGRHAGRALCTGTLISPNLFLTARHCIDGDDGRGLLGPDGKHVVAPEDMPSVLEVRFESRGCRTEPAALRVRRFAYVGTAGWDYAVLALEGRPGLRLGFATLDARPAREHTKVVVVQHPGGGPKQVSIGTLRGYEAAGSLVKHDADTQDGSSGSGLLDLRGRLIALHPLGGCGDAQAGFVNRALTVRAILDDAPALRTELSLACAEDSDCAGEPGCGVGTCSGGTCSLRPDCAQDDPCSEPLCDPEAGVCSPLARECDDGNPCTADVCEPGVGCRAVANAAECTPCGNGLACLHGECLPNQRILRFDQPDDTAPFTQLDGFRVTADASASRGPTLRTTPLEDAQSASLSLSLSLATPGQLAFRHRESTERDFDVFNLWIDDQLVTSWSGTNQWTVHDVPLSAGSHHVRWEYVKDDMLSGGEDAVWLDDVSLPGTAAPCPSAPP